jgi:hypothetical protein
MSTHPLLELFEGLERDFGALTVDIFTEAMRRGQAARFEFWYAVRMTPLAQVYDECRDWRTVAADPGMPQALREKALQDLRYKLHEVVTALRAGALRLPRRRLREEIVNRVSDAKVRQLCVEINAAPDQSVLALAQLIGEALKWALWRKAKLHKTRLKEDGALGPLLDEAIAKGYYTSKVAVRFMTEFKTNFMKTGYDMVRHSESYIPDIAVLNPQIDAVETILAESF